MASTKPNGTGTGANPPHRRAQRSTTAGSAKMATRQPGPSRTPLSEPAPAAKGNRRSAVDGAVAYPPGNRNDVQGQPDWHNIPLDQVGVRELLYPARVMGPDGEQVTVAKWTLSVGLRAAQRGVHMSRLVEALNAWDRRITKTGLERFLFGLSQKLETDCARVALRFPYFRLKRAPVTGVAGLVDYDVTLSASLAVKQIETVVSVIVPVTSLCPCSKAIASWGAHSQRSHVTVTATFVRELCIDTFIALVEKEASCEVFSALKRADEKYVTERAYQTPKFVEDLVRGVTHRLSAESQFGSLSVVAESFESIHNHSAFAAMSKPFGQGRPDLGG